MLVNYEKQPGNKSARIPLSSRPLDLVYFLFFLIHIPTSLILDLQSLYPAWLLPPFLKQLIPFYVGMSGDPLVGGLAGLFGEQYAQTLIWFRSFMYIEAFFQLPTFFIGAHFLYHNKRLSLVYPLIIIYGASTATTTLPCIMHIISTPPPQSITHNAHKNLSPTLTGGQKWLLLGSYVPFFLLPLFMALDMARRISKLVDKGIKQDKWE